MLKELRKATKLVILTRLLALAGVFGGGQRRKHSNSIWVVCPPEGFGVISFAYGTCRITETRPLVVQSLLSRLSFLIRFAGYAKLI